jgi:hypothetical protein
MDISLLSSFLAPFLPYLVRNAEDLGEDVAKKLGAEAWGFARRIWGRLRPKVDERPAAQEAAADVAAKADDPRALGALELQLEKLLAADAQLAEDVARLFAEAEEAGVVASGERAVAIGGDVTSSTVVTGDQNTIGG